MPEMFKKVLLIEDELGYRNPLASFLSSNFCTVFNADDGAQALEKILFHKPDLIILDLLLPKVHGFEVLFRIRNYPSAEVANLPVVIVSNLSGEEDIKKALDLKVNAYLVKSQTNFEEIKNKIIEILYKGKKPPAVKEVWDFSKPNN